VIANFAYSHELLFEVADRILQLPERPPSGTEAPERSTLAATVANLGDT
jgi:hypothetical protein